MMKLGVILGLSVAAALAINLLSAQPPEDERRGVRDARSERHEGRDRAHRDHDHDDRDHGDREGDWAERGDRDHRGENRDHWGHHDWWDHDDWDHGRGGWGSRDAPHPVVWALDRNKNGRISQEEIKNAPQALLALDVNGDRALSETEIEPRYQRGRRGPDFDARDIVEHVFDRDENDDDAISQEEFPRPWRDHFDRIDSNDDGQLNHDEVGRFAEHLEERFEDDWRHGDRWDRPRHRDWRDDGEHERRHRDHDRRGDEDRDNRDAPEQAEREHDHGDREDGDGRQTKDDHPQKDRE